MISRREIKDLIKNKRIKVNDKIIHTSCDVNDSDIIKLDDDIVVYQEFHYLILNKPQGYVTSCKDKDPIVLDLIDRFRDYLAPVGRLDKDTEGLLLFTNDGDLSHKLTHPKNHIPKTYFVKSSFELTKDEMDTIEKGIHSSTLDTLPSIIKKVQDGYLLTIYEGQYHEIKRIFGHFHNEVIYLKRLELGPIKLGNLELGKWRFLNDEEIKSLKEM